MYKLTEKQRGAICDYLNPPDHNFKSINWIKCISQTADGCIFEIGYWITYLGCKPKYNKETAYFTNEQLIKFNL